MWNPLCIFSCVRGSYVMEKKTCMSNVLLTLLLKIARQSREKNKRETRQSWAGEVSKTNERAVRGCRIHDRLTEGKLVVCPLYPILITMTSTGRQPPRWTVPERHLRVAFGSGQSSQQSWTSITHHVSDISIFQTQLFWGFCLKIA